MVLLHIFQGGPTSFFFLLISIETHIHVTITCDFPGGLDPYTPLDPQMYNVAFWHE